MEITKNPVSGVFAQNIGQTLSFGGIVALSRCSFLTAIASCKRYSGSSFNSLPHFGHGHHRYLVAAVYEISLQ
jgi:hypothetical protein